MQRTTRDRQRRTLRRAACTAMTAAVTAAIAAAMAGTLMAAGRVAAAPPPGGWRHERLWDDGQAEFCAYEVTWARYGHHYQGRALLILVKEPWAPDLDVKADTPRRNGFDVLKLNHVRDVATGIYTYHQMASVYFRRDDGAVRKIAATSSEACGISTADMTRGQLRTRSYFDGDGDRTRRWPQEAVPEDGLAVVLRDWVADGAAPPPALRVMPSLLAGRFTDLEPRAWTLRKSDAGRVEVPAGRFAAVQLRLDRDGDWMTFVFEAALPHRLLRFERRDGTLYKLVKGERIRYWAMHDPGGEAWLPPAVR
jgi:hypothetical protein